MFTTACHRSESRGEPSAGNRNSTTAVTSKQRLKRTFRRKALEDSFLKFCQLSTDTGAGPLSPVDYDQLLVRAADFVASEDFDSASSEREILQDDFLSKCESESPKRSVKRLSLPPHLASLCEEQLLTPDQERQLFRRMNYLKYRAHVLLKGPNCSASSQWEIERALGLLRAADWYRDCIVKANVRLVISVVKKFVNPHCGFDDLLSDGIMALIRAVEKFDYQLGFRFSTYATQVVRRNSYRFVMDKQEERLKVSNSLSESGLDIAEDLVPSSMDEQRWNALRSHLGDLLSKLDRREKFIIRARFSLGGHRRVQTLQKLADCLHISKERVRQLEKRAMEKLSMMAVEAPPPLYLGQG